MLILTPRDGFQGGKESGSRRAEKIEEKERNSQALKEPPLVNKRTLITPRKAPFRSRLKPDKVFKRLLLDPDNSIGNLLRLIRERKTKTDFNLNNCNIKTTTRIRIDISI